MMIIKRHLLLLCLYIKYILVIGIYYGYVNIYGTKCKIVRLAYVA